MTGSPLGNRSGQAALFAVLAVAFALSTFASRDWVTGHPFVLLVGLAVGLALYVPTLIALWFFDRREREPWQLVVLVVVSVLCIFAPLAAAGNDLFSNYLPLAVFVGLTEELAKVAPLLLLVAFLPRAVNGTRDGLIYGALGGFAFAAIEFGYYVAYRGFDEVGWTSLTNQVARTNLFGTNNHVLWAAALGAAIGWAASAGHGWKRIAVPLATYIGVALTHSIEDAGGNLVSAMLGGVLIEPLLMSFPDPEATMNANMMLIQILFGTVNVLMINVIILPILFVVLSRSGETERQVIREQLATEDRAIVSVEALQGAMQDRRFRSRSIPGWPHRSAKAIVQLQNELAFHKNRILRIGGNVDTDRAVIALRALLTQKNIESTSH